MDDKHRCAWAGTQEIYVRYHDEEWGRPVADDDRLFEKLCLEGFQSGLSWLTILRKRENFRRAFRGFAIEKVARLDDREVEQLLQDPGIVRHRGKIRSAVNNARRALDVKEEYGTFAAYVWRFEPKPLPFTGSVPSETEDSRRMSKDLRQRGWSFVGPTTVYAFMQAMGLVNDHSENCFCRAPCEAERRAMSRPVPTIR
jgi:DNA-3-methyladenine glycosylase I